jgi:radical SAM protein with 4Fe4S-binding SPASM domain
MNYCRKKDVVPNITINGWGITEEIAKKLVDTCGSIAVSRYHPKDVCYNTVELLTKIGGKQINIHQLVSKETLQDCYKLIDDVKNDKRLNKLNATLFLMLKKKGRGSCSNYVSSQEYSNLIKKLLDSEIRFGMDSCSANSFLKNINDKKMEEMVESCESGLFSIYVDVEGKIHPCSFAENVEWEKGIDLTKIKDFDKEVWNSKLMRKWRKKLLKNKRNCPIYIDIKDI